MLKKFGIMFLVLSMVIGVLVVPASASSTTTGVTPFKQIYSLDTYYFGAKSGEVIEVKPQDIGAISGSGLTVARLDSSNKTPVLYSHTGKGEAVFELNAPDGRTFKGMKIELAGRTYGDAGNPSQIDIALALENSEASYEVIQSYTTEQLSWEETQKTPQVLEIPVEQMKAQKFYVKVSIQGKAGQTWAALSRLNIYSKFDGDDFNDNRRSYKRLNKNFFNLGAEPGSAMPITDPAKIGAVEVSNVDISIIDPSLGYPVLHSNSGNGYATFEVKALDGKKFDKAYMTFRGRTCYGGVKLRFLGGETKETATTLIAQYSDDNSAGPMLWEGDEMKIPLPYAAEKEKFYIKVVFEGGAGQTWTELKHIGVEGTMKDVDTSVYYTAFEEIGINPGSTTNFTDPAVLDAYEISNLGGAYPDQTNFYPVLFSPAGDGHIVYKLSAPKGEEFINLNMQIMGRTYGDDNNGHTSMSITCGDTPENITTPVAEYRSKDNMLWFGDMHSFDLPAMGKKEIYVKIAFQGGPGQTWSCLNQLEFMGKFSKAINLYAVDAGGEYISSLPITGGKITLRADVLHRSADEKYTLIGAVYDKNTGALVETKSYTPAEVNTGGITSYAVEFNLAENANQIYQVKGFLWKSSNDLLPKTQSILLK